jgi:CheY-like chemotaxis protein
MRTVVVFDDSPTVLLYVDLSLRSLGVKVLRVHSGPKTAFTLVDLLREVGSLTAVVMDQHTMTVEGDSLIRRCKACGFACPFVLYSSDPNVESIAKACGATDWARKDDPGRLRAIVERYLGAS